MGYEEKIDRWSEIIARLAEEAILFEVVLSPKPGLVDSLDSGSHTDMDIYTFIKSAASLFEGFHDFSRAGFLHTGTAKELFFKIRPIGKDVEKKMYRATGNINTHKGIVFSMGIILAALGLYLQDSLKEEEIRTFTKEDTDAVFRLTSEMTEGIVSEDFRNLREKSKLTNGEVLFMRHGFTGIRGEAENGYPVVRLKALPRLREVETSSLTLEERLLGILLLLMSITEDSNVVSRGGMESLDYVKREAAAFIKKGGMMNPEASAILKNMNADFIRRNISPGGSADLLSLTIFFGKLEKII